MSSPIYEFCMVSHGSPFRDAAADDWIVLGKWSESRLIIDDNTALYINPFGRENRALKYIKIGVDFGMPRYAHSRGNYEEYDDIVLRKIPLQNGIVTVDVVHCPSSRSRKLECRFQGGDVFHSHTYSEHQNLRTFSLQDILLTALRSRGHASCNTKIVLVRVGTDRVMKPDAFVWQPGEIHFPPDRGRSSESRSSKRIPKRRRVCRASD